MFKFFWFLFLALGAPAAFAGDKPPAKDTLYIMTLLKEVEATELQHPEEALKQYRRALAFSQKINFTRGYFASVRLTTYLLNVLGRHQESHQLAATALKEALRDTVQQYQSICYFALAQSAKWQGKNKDAVKYFKLAAPYMLAHPNRQKAASLYQNLGLIYETEKLYPQALAYFNRALKYDRLAKSPPQDIALDYWSMAGVYVKQRKTQEGMAYYRKAISLLDSERDGHYLSDIYGNIANLHKELAQPDSSLYYYQRALNLNRLSNNPVQELHLLAGLAETYNEMGQFGRAKPLLDSAYALATRHEVGLAEFRNIYREYANTNLGLGNYKAAMPWYEKYRQTNDSLSSMEAKVMLADYELKLRQAEAGQKLAQKQRQIDRLEQVRQRQNLWLVIAALATFVLVSGLLFSYLYLRQRQRSADAALLVAQREKVLAVTQSEIQGQHKERLRIAKEMHDDLGASLTAIGLLSEVVKTRMGTATTPEVEKISSISADMITTLNEIIWSLNTKNDSLNGLIAYTRAYASEFADNTSLSQQMRVSESAREVTIRGADRRNIFLTVKEALNNVAKHAQATQVWFTIRPETHQLLIEVIDDGRGFVADERTRLRNGLGNMQNRMQESGGTCEILSSPGGTRVKITYPYPLTPALKIMQT